MLDDADIEAAVNAAVFGAFMNQGQICMSTERLIVDEDRRRIRRQAGGARLATACRDRGAMSAGSLISSQAADKMEELIADAAERAQSWWPAASAPARWSKRHARPCDAGDAVYAEESFGPVKPVIRVKGEDEAVRVANDTEYGLSSAVFSREIRRARAVAARIKVGFCHIKGPTVGDEAQTPFGGAEGSGHGCSAARPGRRITELRWMTIQDLHSTIRLKSRPTGRQVQPAGLGW